jgi:uncharacterized protein YkwD
MVPYRRLVKYLMSAISNFLKMIMDVRPKKPNFKDDNMISESEAKELLDLHNKTREIYSLSPMIMDTDCCVVAQSHATWMSNSQNVSHMGFSFFGPVQRMAIVGVEPENLGECISFSASGDIKDVMKSWFMSGTHKEIILGKYDKFGIGKALGYKDKHFYWCAIYASLKKAHNVPKVKMSDNLVEF